MFLWQASWHVWHDSNGTLRGGWQVRESTPRGNAILAEGFGNRVEAEEEMRSIARKRNTARGTSAE